MIDHLFKFASEAEAKADPIVGAYFRADGKGGGSWDLSRCIPGLLVWQPSADTIETVAAPGGGSIDVAVHHPIADAAGVPYWYLLVMLPELDPDLQAHAGCVLIADRDAAAAGQPFVIYSPLPAGALNSYMLQPTPLGAAYPFGGAL